MPMSFPTHQSVVSRAEMRNFRAPDPLETQDDYRRNFANYMIGVDPVEASEISSGVSWDKQSPESVLHGGGIFGDAREWHKTLFSFIIKEVDTESIPKEVATGLRVENDKFVYDHYHGKAGEAAYNSWVSDEPLPPINIKTNTLKVFCHPRSFKYPPSMRVGGVPVALFVIPEAYIEDPAGTFMILENHVDPDKRVVVDARKVENLRVIATDYLARYPVWFKTYESSIEIEY